MKSKLSKRFLAILLSCLLVMASFAGTFTVGATTDEDAIRAAFEEYVASTLFTKDGYSGTTYSDAKLIQYLKDKNFADVSIVGTGTTTPESYLQHPQAGFTTGVAGYENLFAAKDGYVAVVLSYNGANIGCIATIPAYTYDHTADITTVSKAEEFTVEGDIITAYNGSANIVVCEYPISASINWGANAANIKAVILKGANTFGGPSNASGNFSGVFGNAKLANLCAVRFDGSITFNESGGDAKLFDGATKLTHIALPNTSQMSLTHWFAAGVKSLVRVDNADKLRRVNYASFSTTALSTFTMGSGHGEWQVRLNGLWSLLAKNYGVTPVYNFYSTVTDVNQDDKGSTRWEIDTNPPIVYFATESALNNFQSNVLYTTHCAGKLTADYRVITNNLTRTAASVKAATDKLSGVAPSATGALTAITAGVTLPDGFTLNWVDDTFAVAGDKVTGTLALSDGTNTVKYDVAIPTMDPIGTVQGVFEEYVASTVFTDNGYSSTYSDAGLMNALIAKGHAVTLVDSYLQHAEAGFVTSALGYENLFAAQDGYVSVLLKDTNGVVTGYTATIPAYTYKHYDIDTITSYATNPEDFVLTDDVITAYNGTAEVLVLDKAVSPTFTVANGSSVKVIIITSGQTFADGSAGFHATANRFSVKFPELLAVRFESGSVAYGGDNGMFAGATKLTHVSLPGNGAGLMCIPHHFLSGATALVRLDNDDLVERVGWQALKNTMLHTIEGGKGRSVWHTQHESHYTAIGAKGVTPVIRLYNGSTLDGDNTASARWNSAYPPIIYSNYNFDDYSTYNNKDLSVLKNATWKVYNPLLLDAIKAQAAINGMIATAKGADALAAAQAAVGEGYTLAWESYELDGMNATGVMTMTDGETTVKLAYDELAMQMVNGASIRYMTPAGIRFATRVNCLAELEAQGYTDINVGTIIAINSAIGTTEFTKDALTAADVKYLEIKTTKWAEAGLTEFGAYENLTFNVVHGIPAASYATDLSARTYVEATKDGVTETWYTDYSELNNTRSIREVAIKVYDGAPESVKGTLDAYINGAQ